MDNLINEAQSQTPSFIYAITENGLMVIVVLIIALIIGKFVFKIRLSKLINYVLPLALLGAILIFIKDYFFFVIIAILSAISIFELITIIKKSRENKEENKIAKLGKKAAESFFPISVFSLFIELTLIIALFTVEKSSLFITIAIFVFNILLFVCAIGDIENKKKAVRITSLNIIGSLFLFVNQILYRLSNISINTPTVLDSNGNVQPYQITGILGNSNGVGMHSMKMYFIAPVFYLLIIVGYFVLISKDEYKKLEEKLFTLDFLSKFRVNENAIEDGSVKVCERADDDKPVRLPYTDRFLHMLVIGPTGCGKTSQILIPMLNQDVKNLEAGITVIEPKGDLADKIYAMAQYYGRKAVYFNPVLENCPSFNPLYGKEEDVIENTVTTFKMLDPDAKQYFQDMNEQLLRNALKILKKREKLTGEIPTLLDVNTIISNPEGNGKLLVNGFNNLIEGNVSGEEEKELKESISYFTDDYYKGSASKIYENTSGIRSQVAKIISNKFLRRVLNPVGGKSDIDFDKHLEEGGVLCITTAQGKLRDLGSFLGYFIILNFQSSVFRRPGNENTRRPHFLYIDEFQKYTTTGFADMLTQGRSYRVASHLATQARAQIGMGVGKDAHNFVNLVSTNCRNVVVFPGVSYDDAKYYSDQFGQDVRELKKVSKSKKVGDFGYNGISESFDERLESRFTPTDIIYRKKGEMTFSWVDHMQVQVPIAGKIEYIPIDINKRLDEMIEENEIIMKYDKEGFADPNEWRDLSLPNSPLKPERQAMWQEVIQWVNSKDEMGRNISTPKTIEKNIPKEEPKEEVIEDTINEASVEETISDVPTPEANETYEDIKQQEINKTLNPSNYIYEDDGNDIFNIF